MNALLFCDLGHILTIWRAHSPSHFDVTPLAAHEVTYPVAADRDPFPGQVVHHPAAAPAGILQVESIDLGHDPQGRFPHRCGPVIERGLGQAQQRTLAAEAELRVVVIDQLAQFTGIRAAEIFLATPAPSAAARSAGTAQPPWPVPLPSPWFSCPW